MLLNHNVIVSFQSEDYTLLTINITCRHVEIVYFVFLNYRRLSVTCSCLAILMSYIQKGYFMGGIPNYIFDTASVKIYAFSRC